MQIEYPVYCEDPQMNWQHILVNRLEGVLYNRIPSLRGKQMFFVPTKRGIDGISAPCADVLDNLFPTHSLYPQDAGSMKRQINFANNFAGEWQFRLIGGTTMKSWVRDNKSKRAISAAAPCFLWDHWSPRDIVCEIKSNEYGTIYLVSLQWNCIRCSGRENYASFLCFDHGHKKAFLEYTKCAISYEASSARNKSYTDTEVIYIENLFCGSLPLTDNDSWEHLVITNDIQTRLKEDLEAFSSTKDWFVRNEIPWSRGYLIVGPSGSGKNSLLRAMAKSSKYLKFSFFVEEDDLEDISLFMTEVRDRPEDPAIILIPSLDYLLGPYRHHYRREAVIAEIKKANRLNGIVLVATAESLHDIEPLVVNGALPFNQIVEVGLPARDIRCKRLCQLFSSTPDCRISEETLLHMGEKTSGFSFNMLKETLIRANELAKGRGSPIIEDRDGIGAVEIGLELLKRTNKSIQGKEMP